MLTLKELGQLAPASLAMSPAPHCSPNYVMIPTPEIVAALEREGFVPVSARQDSIRSAEHDANHARHQVRFRLLGTEHIADKQTLARMAVPEIVVINSSDGRSPFAMEMGLYRQICSNGLIVARTIDSMGMIHKRTTLASVIEGAQRVTKATRPVFEKIKTWMNVPMDEEAQRAFGTKAAALRYGPAAALAYDPLLMIAPRREADADRHLWNVFNCAQENGMRGGMKGRMIAANGAERGVTARELTGIAAETNFNMALWELAEEFARKG